MKAVVLAAGLGTRLNPITVDTPKPMLTVGGRPVIDRVLEMVAQSGVQEVFAVQVLPGVRFPAVIGLQKP